MCGIAGFLTSKVYSSNFYNDTLLLMGAEIINRGPDNYGVWYDEKIGIGFSHRRLSILDLSECGNQPMKSRSGRYIIVFNGEIYNHLIIRQEIKNENGFNEWNGNSDTETLIFSIELWGLKKTLEKCKGMFALALWDEKDKILSLARDRVGEKPLYYGYQNGDFLFSSQVNSIKIHPSSNLHISPKATLEYIKYGYVPAPLSIYDGIYKLLPGQILYFSKNDNNIVFDSYWNFDSMLKKAKERPFEGSFKEATEYLDSLINNSVSNQMISDVPIGTFLSGGIDSSTIAAIMQSNATSKIKTFSIGFDEKEYNEAIYAKAISEYLGTEHYEMYVTSNDTLNILPYISEVFDEPFSDSSQIPTYILTQMTKKEVTVALSGDGGDELFCGYNRYLSANKYWRFLSKIPIEIRTIIEKSVNYSLINNDLINNLLKNFNTSDFQVSISKIQKAYSVLSSKDISDLYQRLISKNLFENKILLNEQFYNSDICSDIQQFDLNDIEKMMYLDFKSYLVDDILVKVDRCSMAVSLESRVPFLDHEIIEFAWSLPFNYKIKGNQGKLILKDVLKKYIPNNLIERPKKGFGIPIGNWLRGPLVDWVESYINEDLLVKQKIFNSNNILKMWYDHKTGRRNYAESLWNVLMFQAWYFKNFEKF